MYVYVCMYIYIYIYSFKNECKYVYVCVRVRVYVNVYVNISHVPPWNILSFHEFPCVSRRNTFFPFWVGFRVRFQQFAAQLLQPVGPHLKWLAEGVSQHMQAVLSPLFFCTAVTLSPAKVWRVTFSNAQNLGGNGWRKWQPFAYCRSRPIKSIVCFHMILLLSTIVPVLATTAKRQSPIVFLDIRIFLWQVKRTINGFSWLYRRTFMICSTNAISQESPRKFITRWPSSSQNCVTVTNSFSI